MQAAAPKVIATSIPLSTSFRFAHEPILTGRGDRSFIGRAVELDVLAERLLFSEGGSFLITGYRGVGKTSFVNCVIDRMKELLSWASRELGNVTLIPVQLTLARAVKPVELMYLVIRRLYEELTESDLLQELPDELRDELLLASRRTSMTMTQKFAESLEKSYGVSEGSVSGKLLNALAKFSWTHKETRSRNDELVFLTYDEKSAEHDLLRIARRLSRGYTVKEGRWRRFGHWLNRRPRPRRRLKFVFVFDEIDKLDDADASPDAQPAQYLDEMLASLKNMLTTSGISFLFVAGKDLHDRWLLDLGRGDSVYESVFCYDKYLSCMWEDAAEIATRFVERRQLGSLQQQTLGDFEEFLCYKGRGIPRRIIRTFNEYVRWVDERPLLQFSRSDARRFRFYADLQRLLSGKDESLFGSLSDEASTERDRQRLGAYYFIDWVLAHGTHPFTLEEAVAASRELSRKIAPAKEVAPEVIRHVIDLLVGDEILERVHAFHDLTIVVDPHHQPVARYKLTRRRLAELGHFDDSEVRIVQTAEQDAPEGLRIMDLIGRGGMGSVFRAWDEVEGRLVAVKMVDSARFGNNLQLLQRIRLEAQILQSLRHRNVVRFLRVIEQKSRVYIVMEYVDGSTLRGVLNSRRRLPVNLTCWIAGIIADAVQYIHSNNIVRLDLKPDNVLIQRDGMVYLSDFGISKFVGSDHETSSGFIVGTPAYMAPEQFAGEVTAASDVYSFGIVLFEMLTGNTPYKSEVAGTDLGQLAHAVQSGERVRVSEYAEVPPVLDALVERCLSRDPSERPSLADVREALRLYTSNVGPGDLQEYLRNGAREAERDRSHEDRSTAVRDEVTPVALMLPEELATIAIKERGDDAPTINMGKMLIVLQPQALEGRAFLLLPGKTRIGRSRGSDIALEDESVSRFHADLEIVEGVLFITDLNSTNGVFVGDQRVRQRTPVPFGSVIRIGAVALRFQSGNDQLAVIDASQPHQYESNL